MLAAYLAFGCRAAVELCSWASRLAPAAQAGLDEGAGPASHGGAPPAPPRSMLIDRGAGEKGPSREVAMPFQVEGLARGLAEKAECGEKDVSMVSSVSLYLTNLPPAGRARGPTCDMCMCRRTV